jgi:hypothetical protein
MTKPLQNTGGNKNDFPLFLIRNDNDDPEEELDILDILVN